MRKITLAVVATVAVLVLLFSYRTSTAGLVGASSTAPPGIVGPAVPGPGATSGTSQRPSPGTGTSRPSGADSADVLTVNGTVVDNGYGPVQVQVRIAKKRIVDLSTLALPEDGHSRRINSFAVPELRDEVLRAQSAKVDVVSGATATSDAYTRSLQAALDSAHFGGGS